MIANLLLAILIVGLQGNQQFTPDTSQNLKAFLDSNSFVFVAYLAPRCGHCKAFTPQLQILQKQAKDKSYKVLQIDCQLHKEICLDNNINGYPTFRLYYKGNLIRYEGNRKAASIQQWIQNIMNLQIKQIDAQEASRKIGNEVFILASGLESDKLDLIRVAQFISEDCGFFSLQSTSPFLRLYRKDGGYLQYYYNSIVPQQLSNWIFNKLKPVILPLNSTRNTLYFERQIDYEFVLIFFDHQDSEYKAKIWPLLQNLCNLHSKTLLCTFMDGRSQIYKKVSQVTKTQPGTPSSVFIVSRDLQFGYQYTEQQFTDEEIQSWAGLCMQNQIFKTFEVIRDKKKIFEYKNVIKLTQQNFNQTIKSNRNVFVQFYSVTCQHCIDFAPQYDRFTEQFKKKYPDVLFAAVDARHYKNIEVQQNISGFPTLILYINGHPVNYQGDRESKELTIFVQEVTRSKLLITINKNDRYKPYVAIYGVKQDHFLSCLPALFNRYPIYLVTGEGQAGLIQVQIHDKQPLRVYKGQINANLIASWLQDQTSPVLVSLGEQKPAKKLLKAVRTGTPIVGLINKHSRDTISKQLLVLQEYCRDKTEIVCGYVHPDEPDYESIIQWLKDQDNDKNKLAFIDLKVGRPQFYQGDLQGLTTKDIAQFVDKNVNVLYVEEDQKASSSSQVKEDQKPESQQL